VDLNTPTRCECTPAPSGTRRLQQASWSDTKFDETVTCGKLTARIGSVIAIDEGAASGSPALVQSVTQNVPMNTGWTWFSLNVEAEDMSVGALFASVSLAYGDYLKSQTAFTTYYSGYGFFGQLSALTADTSYALRLSASTTLSLVGTPTALPKAITLSTGWTWMPSPYQTAVALTNGMPALNGGYAAGDQVKSQSAFSEFYAGYGWFGALSNLESGKGYRVKSANGGAGTFAAQ